MSFIPVLLHCKCQNCKIKTFFVKYSVKTLSNFYSTKIGAVRGHPEGERELLSPRDVFCKTALVQHEVPRTLPPQPYHEVSSHVPSRGRAPRAQHRGTCTYTPCCFHTLWYSCCPHASHFHQALATRTLFSSPRKPDGRFDNMLQSALNEHFRESRESDSNLGDHRTHLLQESWTGS